MLNNAVCFPRESLLPLGRATLTLRHLLKTLQETFPTAVFSVSLVRHQFNSIQKTLIIPQGAILLWSWRARKKQQHKVKRTIQQTQHHQQKSLTLTG